MPTRPEDVINEALGELGLDEIADLTDGSEAAQRGLRLYDSTLRAMHAAAPWNFARRQQQLALIGDRNGVYSTNTFIPSPWTYQYEWPIDCVHARYVVGAGATGIDASGNPTGSTPAWNRPSPFQVADAPIPNDVASSWDTSEGHSPESTRVILTQELGAILIYTGLVQYPDAWDALFRKAFVASLAVGFCTPRFIKDPRVALAYKNDQRNAAKEALIEARVRDGNEGWTVVDHTPDWIRARTSGGYASDWSGGWVTMPMIEDAGGVY